jgi:hypothetical protein
MSCTIRPTHTHAPFHEGSIRINLSKDDLTLVSLFLYANAPPPLRDLRDQIQPTEIQLTCMRSAASQNKKVYQKLFIHIICLVRTCFVMNCIRVVVSNQFPKIVTKVKVKLYISYSFQFDYFNSYLT